MPLIGRDHHNLQVVPDLPAATFDGWTLGELRDAAHVLLGALIHLQVNELVARLGDPADYPADRRRHLERNERAAWVGYARTPSSANPRIATLRALGEGR